MNKNHVITKLFDHQVKCSKLLVISQVLFWVVMDHDEVEVDKNAKKNEANVRHTVRKNLDNKGFIIRDLFFLRDKSIGPSLLG